MTTGTDADNPLPPHSVEAEMALLGSLIVAGTETHQYAEEAMKLIRDDRDFYMPRHQVVYQAARECYAKRGRMDSVLLVERLRENGKYEELRLGNQSPQDFLVSLAESVPTGVNAPFYAAIVADRARRRRLAQWAEGIQKQAYRLDVEPMTVARQAWRSLEKVVGKVPEKVNGHSSAGTPEGTPASKGAGASSTVESKAARNPVSR